VIARCRAILSLQQTRYVGDHQLSVILSQVSSLPRSALYTLAALEKLHTAIVGNYSKVIDIQEFGVDSIYGLAVRELSEELTAAEPDQNALFISSVLLMAVELLQRRRQNGLKHRLGAFATLMSGACSGERDLLCRIHDLQSMLYSDGVRASIYPPRGAGNDGRVAPGDDHHMESCIGVIHAAQAHIADVYLASVDDSNSPSANGSNIDYHRLQLEQTSLTLHEAISVPRPEASTTARILLNLAIMTRLHLEQLFASNESSWDHYLPDFQIIIDNCLQIARLHNMATSHNITLGIGIIPALHLVALKCRHSALRLQAVDLLETAGSEGPFIGTQSAAMARRAMSIEGQSPMTGDHTPDHHVSTAVPSLGDLPPENVRLTHVSVADNEIALRHHLQLFSGRTTLRLLRRRVPGPASGPSYRAHFLSSTSYRSQNLARNRQGQIVELDQNAWELWSEPLDFGLPSSSPT
jgi:hypothetical protein